MKKLSLVAALGVFVVVAALSGCAKSTKPTSLIGAGSNGGATAVDVAQANDAVASSPALINENQYTTTAPMSMSLGGGASIIRPIFWWRTINSTARTVDLAFSNPDSLGRPTTAIATIHKHFTGSFNILAGDTALSDTTRRIVHKPLDDLWTRQLKLRRFWIDSTGTKVLWRVVGTSGVTVTSNNATTRILSVRIQAGTLDTTVTDPLQLERLRRVLWLPDDTPVHVTVTTGRPDDIVVLYRFMERRRFVSHGDGTYTADFREFDFPGMRHFGVNAFSSGTLLDDKAAYDSQAWVLPFAVRTADCFVDRN